MGLSEYYREKIKSTLDIEEGGRLRAIGERAAAANAPILVIGLGGTGIDSLLVTKKLVYDRVVREKRADGTYAEKPRNIEFLGIDTDEYSRKAKYQGLGLNEDAEEIQMCFCWNALNPLPEYISSWFDPSIFEHWNPHSNNGAGAIRQIGRLALMLNVDHVIRLLEDKIRKVTDGFPMHAALEVFILTGISGGTGSGMFLDIPYLVRAISDKISGRPVVTTSLVFLPDVNADRWGMPADFRQTLYANGFAALKELDYLMDIENVGDSFTQDYRLLKVTEKTRPYDSCLLLSDKNQRGVPLNGGYETVTEMAAEIVFRFMLDAGGTPPITYFRDKACQDNSIYQTMLRDNKHPVPYVYTAVGVSLARLPVDDLMCILAYRMYQQIEGFWDQRPNDQDIDAVETFFRLSKKIVNGEARTSLPQVDTTQITRKIVRENHAQVIQLYEQTLKRQKSMVVENLERMLARLEEALTDEDHIINQYFKDLEKGPVYAQKCLYSTENRSVITGLRQYQMDFAGAIPSFDQINALTQQVAEAQQDVSQGLPLSRKLLIYFETMDQLYQAKLNQFVYDQISTFYSNACAILSEQCNAIYAVASDLTRALMPIFRSYGWKKMAPIANPSWFSWPIVAPGELIRICEKKMAADQSYAVDFESVAQNFYSYLFDSIDKWRGEKQDAVEELNAFFCRQFRTVLDYNMDYYLGMIAEENGRTTGAFIEEFIADMTRRTEVCFPLGRNFPHGAVVPCESFFFSLPDHSPMLQNTVCEEAAHSSGIVQPVGVRDSIFVMKFMSGLPLSANDEMGKYNQAYLAYRHKPGLHLYTPMRVARKVFDTDWQAIPSPYPEPEWQGGFVDLEESKINAHYRVVLKKALAYGYVRLDGAERTMTLYYGSPIDRYAIARECLIDLDEDDPIREEAARAYVEKVSRLLERRSIQAIDDAPFSHRDSSEPVRCDRRLQRTDMVRDADGTIKESYAEMIFIRMYRPRQRVEEMVKNHEDALAAIDKVRSRVMDESFIEIFVKSRITGLVKPDDQKGNTMVYENLERIEAVLVETTPGQANYLEYYSLKRFKELSAQIRAELAEKAQSILESDEDIDRTLKALETYKEDTIDSKLEDLNWDYEDIEDGTKILDTYNYLSRICQRLYEMLTCVEAGDSL